MNIKTREQITPEESQMMVERAEEWKSETDRFQIARENRAQLHSREACLESG